MLLCNVGVLKTVQCTTVWQQWLVARWLGLSVTVRVKVRSRAGNGVFLFQVRCLGVYVRLPWRPVSEGTPVEDPRMSKESSKLSGHL